ncbi:MAG: acyl-CoA dehydrogenase family protein, partial [Dermatophilaceae bacterium]
MAATRLMPTEESRHLIDLTREVCRKELAPLVDDFERTGGFPERAFRTLGELGLLSLPYPEEFGGGGQPYEVYLQVVEEIATVWMS